MEDLEIELLFTQGYLTREVEVRNHKYVVKTLTSGELEQVFTMIQNILKSKGIESSDTSELLFYTLYNECILVFALLETDGVKHAIPQTQEEEVKRFHEIEKMPIQLITPITDAYNALTAEVNKALAGDGLKNA